MRQALEALNAVVADGVISTYAIGGAIGASFYIEAQATDDLDIFVILPTTPGGILSLTPIYEACLAKGGSIDGQYIRFGPWPIQILSAYNPLVEDALSKAVAIDFEGIPTRVFTAEHTCAVAIDTARSKDFRRVEAFIEQNAVDIHELESLLERYNLPVPRSRIPNWPDSSAHHNPSTPGAT